MDEAEKFEKARALSPHLLHAIDDEVDANIILSALTILLGGFIGRMAKTEKFEEVLEKVVKSVESAAREAASL